MGQKPDIKPIVLDPPLNVTVIRDSAGLELLKDFFTRCGGVVGWDVETTVTKDFYWRKIRTVQFGNLVEQFVIDLLPFCDNNPDTLYSSQGEYGKHLTPGLKTVLDIIEPVVCSKDFLKVGVNLGFEYMSFYFNFGLRTWNFYDCMIVEKCIWAGGHGLKDYAYFSMESLMERYFHVSIDKELQTSFTLDQPLTPAQYDYAALDTRLPLSIRAVQLLILKGATYKGLLAEGKTKAAKYLEHIDPIVTGDNLLEIAQIENEAIGAFQDMHLHGERIDRDKWLARVNRKKAELKDLIENVLDPIFLPIVGSKNEVITDESVQAAELNWKGFNAISSAEIQLKSEIRTAKKSDLLRAERLEAERTAIESSRKEKKEHYKTVCSGLKKKRTAINKLAAECEGSALINYGSNSQLLKVLVTMKGLKQLEDLEDDTLEKHKHHPVMAAIRRYHGLAKVIGTYGEQWATEWKTKPCKEEGWLHPGDGRLHSVFNQYDAETGRSSSEKPNGQNIEKDKEVRECFIADSDEDCIVTADMAGAELRIIAELAQDPIWIEAFARGEDVHSVGTEILYSEKWPLLTLPSIAKPDGWTLQDCKDEVVLTLTGADGKEIKIGPCAYFATKDNGQPARQKCKCPEHEELRGGTKSTNFLLAYGGGPSKLAGEIKKSMEEARDLMALHEQKFPAVWQYLSDSGKNASIRKKSFDMFGRRRLFPEPARERAREKAKKDKEKRLRLKDDQPEKNIATFMQVHKRKPTKDEEWTLTHRQPTSAEVANSFKAMHSSIERQGKNHCIQGTNATIAKKAMSAGFSPDGKPYLWHTLPQYGARQIKFVHDELVISCPKKYGQQVADLIGEAFRMAASEKMTRVEMTFDYNIAQYWKK